MLYSIYTILAGGGQQNKVLFTFYRKPPRLSLSPLARSYAIFALRHGGMSVTLPLRFNHARKTVSLATAILRSMYQLLIAFAL